jgi:hypothetical protein
VVTVPDGLTAVANGALVRRSSHSGLTSFWWSERYPMAPYLATATLGRVNLTESTVDGVPSYVAVDPRRPWRTSWPTSGTATRSP